jgi:hypothetical protein
VLRRIGADVAELKPSSPIEPYFQRHPDAFLPLSHLAPGRLPKPHVDAPVHVGLSLAAMGCGYAGVACQCLGAWPKLSTWLCVTSFACWLALFIAGRAVKPSRVQLAWLRDFRDLSRVLAGEREGGWPGFEVLPANSRERNAR